ncbi:MAG: hypothetical protein IJB19_00680 [Clostridia bacterium]|nr:hypothetical protein [Clostridia bacterium]
MRSTTDKRLCAIVFPILLAAFLYIAHNIPYTHDDWDWGLEIGADRWLSGELNNRYTGTFFVLLMTRSAAAKTLIMGLSMLLIPWLTAKLVSKATEKSNRLFLSLVAVGVFTSMPAITWRQTYGWVSAFANFCLATVFILMILLLLQRCFTAPHPPLCCGVLTFILVFVTQFFTENVSLLLPFVMLGGCIYACRKKRARTVMFFGLAGSICGAVLMFYNPIYGELLENGVALEGIREFSFSVEDSPRDILFDILHTLTNKTLPMLYETHPALCVFLSVSAGASLWKRNKFFAILTGMLLLTYSFHCIYAAEMQRQAYYWVHPYPEVRMWGSILFTVIFACALLFGKTKCKRPAILLALVAYALVVPLCVMHNLGPRCFFVAQVCLLGVGLFTFADANIKKAHICLPTTVLLITVVFHMHVYSTIGACNDLRAELIEEAIEENAEVLALPLYDDLYVYSWGYNPQTWERAEYYREFYGLPKTIDLIFLPFDTVDSWPNIPEKMYEDALLYPYRGE